jgi:transposase
MPAKNFLKPEQQEKLQKALKTEENGDIRERILMLLLLNDGKTQQEIAKFVGCSINKVSYWCVHGDPDNLETLKDERMKGNYHKATDKYIEMLLATVEKEPSELGYEFGRWTAQRLAAYLEEQTGIKLSGSQVRRILKQKKYVYLWAKYSLESKRNEKSREAFQEKIEEYLRVEQESPERLQVWFWDESGFSLRVIRRKNWCQKGTRKKLRGDRRKGRVNVMGGLRYSDKKRFIEFVEKGNSESFYQVLKVFYQQLKEEWIEAGNSEKEFEKKGAKIVIILDNASFHKKQEYLDKIEAEMPNLQLEFLPEYSPDYNLIELVWHSAKEYLAHRLFQSVEELESVLNQLLNEGGLIIQWGRKLKNKGNAVIPI